MNKVVGESWALPLTALSPVPEGEWWSWSCTGESIAEQQCPGPPASLPIVQLASPSSPGCSSLGFSLSPPKKLGFSSSCILLAVKTCGASPWINHSWSEGGGGELAFCSGWRGGANFHRLHHLSIWAHSPQLKEPSPTTRSQNTR